MLKKITLVGLLSFTLLFESCVGIGAVSTISSVYNDRRSAGTIIDDETLGFYLDNWITDNPIVQKGHVNFLVYNRAVLLTGEVPNQTVKKQIEQQMLLTRKDIVLAHNELTIAPNSKFLKRLHDLQLKVFIDAVFYDQDIFHPGHILVRVEQGVVYLMGSVTKREANKAIKQTSKVKGTKKIVTLFNYLKKRPQAEIDKAKKRQKAAEYQANLQHKKAELKKEQNKIQQEIDNINR